MEIGIKIHKKRQIGKSSLGQFYLFLDNYLFYSTVLNLRTCGHMDNGCERDACAFLLLVFLFNLKFRALNFIFLIALICIIFNRTFPIEKEAKSEKLFESCSSANEEEEKTESQSHSFAAGFVINLKHSLWTFPLFGAINIIYKIKTKEQ